MSPKQNLYYWRLWGAAKKARPALDRKALHAQEGLPDSHLVFSQDHFDRFKAACLAISRPASVVAQVEQLAMPRTRRIWLTERLCEALEKRAAEYARGIVKRMNREGAFGRAELALEDLTEPELDKVLTALRKACRRRWSTKPCLIRAIRAWCRSEGIEDAAACEAIVKVLPRAARAAIELAALHYDELLLVMAAVRMVNKVEEPY